MTDISVEALFSLLLGGKDFRGNLCFALPATSPMRKCGPSKPQWESERVISIELCLSLVLHHLKIKIVYACLVHGYGIENLLLTSFCIVPRRNMISLNWKLEKTIYDIVLRCSIGHRSWKYLIWDVALRVQ